MFYRHDAPEVGEANYTPEGFGNVTQNKVQHYSLADVWTFSPTIVNELRLGYQRHNEARILTETPPGF